MTEIHRLLTYMGACGEAIAFADKWAASGSPKTVWEACNRSDWMIWLLSRKTVDLDDPRLRLMACDFAESVLHLVPKGEDRPRKAIEAARAFCAGTITREEMDAASAAASAAAWDAASAAARDAQAKIIRRYFPKCPPVQAKYLKATVA